MNDLSIIVCTRNRADSLVFCLQSIEISVAGHGKGEVELLVIDNNSTDNTAALVQDWQKSATVKSRLLRAEKPGLSEARNVGLCHAVGKVIAFTDDDCRVAPDYIEQIAAAYGDDHAPVIRGGRVELGDPRDLPFTIKTDLERQEFFGGNPGGFIHGCNLTMTRTAIDRVGGFDVRLGAGKILGAAEDADYVYRAHRTGIPVFYDPAIVVYHHHGRRDIAEVKRLQSVYDLSDGALYAKYALGDWKLLRHIARLGRNIFREFLGGARPDEEFKTSYRQVLWDNLRGAWRFWRDVN
jgi:glycosyltransferase involved in cell wall biosynthesis